MVSNGGKYTKHIYMGSQRITSKVSNSGIFSSSPVKDTLQAKYATLTTKIKERFDTLGVTYKGTTQTGGLVSVSQTPPLGGWGAYFYHSDHLGSSSLITDATGALVQHIEYVPFGETFIDERNGSWHTPYLFNAKERDEETGLYYYHARYYDSRRSVWLSVDPLAEKKLWMTSYNYCSNNPIVRVDPDGKKDVVFNNDGSYKTIQNDNFWHNLWFGTRGVINDTEGKPRNTFRFNNTNDSKRFELKPGEKGYLRGVDEKYLINNLNKLVISGTEPTKKMSIVDKYKYIYQQSMSGGYLDFAYADGFNTYTLYIVNGTAYDNYDAGNFIWGNAMKKLGIPYELVKFGSEYNGFWNGKLQNNEWNKSQHWIKRISWFGDSKEDQQAILRGYDYPYIKYW